MLDATKTVPASPAEHLFDLSSIDWNIVLKNGAMALVIALVGYWLARWVSRIIERALTRAHVEPTLAGFLRRTSYAVMMIFVIITALSVAGFNPTSLIAILGAAGLAVGLALKDSLSNIASGVMLIVLRPFRAGDHVVVADQEGTVLEVRIFQTRIRAFDQRVIILPNSTITTAPIINYSSLPTRRIEIAVGVGYNDDLREARELLLKIANEDKRVLADPAPFVQVTNLGESSVELKLFAHARNDDFGDAKSSLTEAIRVRLIEHGLSIPYPQRDLHVYHHNADGTPLTEIITRSVADDGDMPAKPAS